jgi:lipopolysaccharide transport system permease protein
MSAWVLAYQSVMLSGQWPGLAQWSIISLWLVLLSGVLAWLNRNSREELVDWL